MTSTWNLSVASLALLVAACAHSGSGRDANAPSTASETATESDPAAPPPRPRPQPQVVETSSPPQPTSCAVRCIVPEARYADSNAQERVGASLGSTFHGMRACMQRAGLNASYSPMLTLRFGSTGQLTTMVADDTGFEAAEPCISDTVAASAPGVTMADRAVVRCNERCPRASRRYSSGMGYELQP